LTYYDEILLLGGRGGNGGGIEAGLRRFAGVVGNRLRKLNELGMPKKLGLGRGRELYTDGIGLRDGLKVVVVVSGCCCSCSCWYSTEAGWSYFSWYITFPSNENRDYYRCYK
jgi:hypothetical protein